MKHIHIMNGWRDIYCPKYAMRMYLSAFNKLDIIRYETGK